jgi:ribose transport system substrate-binding protein
MKSIWRVTDSNLAVVIALACCTLSLFSACTTRSPQSPTGPTPKRLAFVTNNAADFWTIARHGTEKADAELLDVTVEFKIPSDGTAAEQKRILDDLLAKGTDGIAISPVDPENQTRMLNDTARQAVVITQDSGRAERRPHAVYRN